MLSGKYMHVLDSHDFLLELNGKSEGRMAVTKDEFAASVGMTLIALDEVLEGVEDE